MKSTDELLLRCLNDSTLALLSGGVTEAERARKSYKALEAAMIGDQTGNMAAVQAYKDAVGIELQKQSLSPPNEYPKD
jgi:hypothetical protein